MRELLIDLDAIAANLATMRAQCPDAKVCAVVKANAYGHGMIPVALRLEAEGAEYLGVADISEGLELREAGIRVPILAWLHAQDEDFVAGVDSDIEIGVSTVWQLERAAEAARTLSRCAKVHLKLDTGLGRNGATERDWDALFAVANQYVAAGLISVIGIFSHLSSTSAAEDQKQIDRFERGLALAKSVGIEPPLRHLTASDGSLSYPNAHYEMVRIGVALYGLSPFENRSAADFGLKPAMTATSAVVQVKRVPENEGISYGYLHRTVAETNLALVPVGYAEGIPRSASGRTEIWVNGVCYPLQSRIAMDQFVLDVGDDEVKPGDRVVIFGDPLQAVAGQSYPSADDLARACGTINYEIVTRMGGRFKRVYLGAGAPKGQDAGRA